MRAAYILELFVVALAATISDKKSSAKTGKKKKRSSPGMTTLKAGAVAGILMCVFVVAAALFGIVFVRWWRGADRRPQRDE